MDMQGIIKSNLTHLKYPFREQENGHALKLSMPFDIIFNRLFEMNRFTYTHSYVHIFPSAMIKFLFTTSFRMLFMIKKWNENNIAFYIKNRYVLCQSENKSSCDAQYDRINWKCPFCCFFLLQIMPIIFRIRFKSSDDIFMSKNIVDWNRQRRIAQKTDWKLFF